MTGRMSVALVQHFVTRYMGDDVSRNQPSPPQWVRTLPIRVAPIPGEAMDSWLEALAARSQSAWGDLLDAVGLTYTEKGAPLPSSRLLEAMSIDLTAVATATGVPHDVLTSMTIDALCRGSTDIETRQHLLPGSRYCPSCLAGNGGRWALWWRLRWAFACPTHLCLLVDECPRCGRAPRTRAMPLWMEPTPARCTHPAPDTLGRRPPRCGADLTSATTVGLPEHHPALDAQDAIQAVIAAGSVSTGIYQDAPVSAAQYLCDLRAIGMRALRYGSAADLRPMSTRRRSARDPLGEAADFSAEHRLHTAIPSPPTAAQTAVGACAAVPVLSSESVQAAGERVRWLVDSSRAQGLAVSATNIGWGRDTSAALTATQLAALRPYLSHVAQVHYRCLSNSPRRPPRTVPPVHRSLPALFWHRWVLPIDDTHVGFEQIRLALSVGVVIAAGRLRLEDACACLGMATTPKAASRALQALGARPDWAATTDMLTRVADTLAEHPAPIDYERRRHLPTGDLLPESSWHDICRRLGLRPGRVVKHRLIRCWLYERITGSPGRMCLHAIDTGPFRALLADLPRTLYPELVSALDAAARQFLDDNGAGDEPLLWSPPHDAAPDWLSRRPPSTAIDVGKLHELVQPRDSHLGTVATRLRASLEVVREALNDAPAPRPTLTLTQRRATGAVMVGARAQLTPEVLADLYLRQRLTLKAIGETVGVSKQTIGRLAREYGIPLRPSAVSSRRHALGTDE